MLIALWATVALAEPELTGTWRLAEDPAALAQTHAKAIDDAVASLPWIMRPMARPFLKNSVNNCAALGLTFDAERFALTCDDRPPLDRVRGPAKTEFVGIDGDSYTLELDVTDASAQLTFTGERGGQRSHFRRDGDALVLRKEIFSQHLPQPIVWEVSYERG